MSVKFIDYRNKQILYIDLGGVTSSFEVIDIGEKAKKLVGLNRRKKLNIIYNVEKLRLNTFIFNRLPRLFVNKHIVERRVIFGFTEETEVLYNLLAKFLGASRNTLFAQDYTKALNLITEDEIWLAVFSDFSKDKKKPEPDMYDEQDITIKPASIVSFDNFWGDTPPPKHDDWTMPVFDDF
jgi:hypothetical protein